MKSRQVSLPAENRLVYSDQTKTFCFIQRFIILSDKLSYVVVIVLILHYARVIGYLSYISVCVVGFAARLTVRG